MHIRLILYILIVAGFTYTSIRYGIGEVWPFIPWAVACIGAGELGAYLKWRKHRNDK